jgi:serine/threonine-protein kinase
LAGALQTPDVEDGGKFWDPLRTGLTGSPGSLVRTGEPFPCAFGEYELLEEIARGGMGVVYRARRVRLNQTVALKMILAGQFASQQEVLRFRAEAEATANLRHPGIVAIHEIGEMGGQHYFSMDFVQGRNLAEMVSEGPLPGQRAARYSQAIAQAIHHAHQQGVLHRDLKPSNRKKECRERGRSGSDYLVR